MLIGMLTESKTEILLKIGAKLDKVYTRVSTIDGVAAIEVDTDKIGVLVATVHKTEVDVDKTDEVLNGCPEAGSVEEVTVSSVDEVLGTSIIEAWSWEVLGAYRVVDTTIVLAISPIEADSTDATVLGGV